jgi:hypothetical protein
MAACPQTRRWGPGERLVFEPYTKEVYEETFKWIADHGIFADSAMGSGNYEQVMAAFHKLHFSSVAASSQERLDFIDSPKPRLSSSSTTFILSGEVVKRKKKLSKKYYGTSHVLSKDEAKFVFERGCEQLVLGSGQMGNVHLSPEAEAYFAKKGCTVLLQPTPEAIGVFNRSHAKKIGLFHVTC